MIDPRYRILLVEDDAADADLALCALKESGLPVEIHRVADGVGCMDYLNQAHAAAPSGEHLPSLILLDLNMPRMDGREVLRRVKSAEGLRRIPVVVLTTSAARHDVNASYDLGANSFITKPLDFDDFAAKMQSTVQYWFSAVRLPAMGWGP